jgi:hypothetical protein
MLLLDPIMSGAVHDSVAPVGSIPHRTPTTVPDSTVVTYTHRY